MIDHSATHVVGWNMEGVCIRLSLLDIDKDRVTRSQTRDMQPVSVKVGLVEVSKFVVHFRCIKTKRGEFVLQIDVQGVPRFHSNHRADDAIIIRVLVTFQVVWPDVETAA